MELNLLFVLSKMSRSLKTGENVFVSSSPLIQTPGNRIAPGNVAARRHHTCVTDAAAFISASLRGIAARICGGERRVCLTASGKHNGSIHQEEPGRRSGGAEEELEGRGRRVGRKRRKDVKGRKR